MGKINMSIEIDFDDAIFDDPASDAGDVETVIERAKDYLRQNSLMAGEIAADLIEQLGEHVIWVDAKISSEGD